MARLWVWAATTTLLVVLASAKPVGDETEPDAEVTLPEQDLEAEAAEATVEDRLDPASKGVLLFGGQKNALEDAAVWGATTIFVTLAVTASIAVGGLLEDLKEDKVFKKRSLTPTSWLESSDTFFAIAFLTGNYECLNRMACEDSARASDILSASKKVLKGAKLFKPVLGKSVDELERVVYGFQDAMKYKRGGGDCSAMYACSVMPRL